MNSIGDFVALVRDELGLPITVQDVGRELSYLPGWDSMHMLWLLTCLERTTGRALSLIDLLEAPNLESIYCLATGEHPGEDIPR